MQGILRVKLADSLCIQHNPNSTLVVDGLLLTNAIKVLFARRWTQVLAAVELRSCAITAKDILDMYLKEKALPKQMKDIVSTQ
jgi:hypothetical protein